MVTRSGSMQCLNALVFCRAFTNQHTKPDTRWTSSSPDPISLFPWRLLFIHRISPITRSSSPNSRSRNHRRCFSTLPFEDGRNLIERLFGVICSPVISVRGRLVAMRGLLIHLMRWQYRIKRFSAIYWRSMLLDVWFENTTDQFRRGLTMHARCRSGNLVAWSEFTVAPNQMKIKQSGWSNYEQRKFSTNRQKICFGKLQSLRARAMPRNYGTLCQH